MFCCPTYVLQPHLLPLHSYLRSEKRTCSWEKTNSPSLPPARVWSYTAPESDKISLPSYTTTLPGTHNNQVNVITHISPLAPDTAVKKTRAFYSSMSSQSLVLKKHINTFTQLTICYWRQMMAELYAGQSDSGRLASFTENLLNQLRNGKCFWRLLSREFDVTWNICKATQRVGSLRWLNSLLPTPCLHQNPAPWFCTFNPTHATRLHCLHCIRRSLQVRR